MPPLEKKNNNKSEHRTKMILLFSSTQKSILYRLEAFANHFFLGVAK
jgi:hypothetical protein